MVQADGTCSPWSSLPATSGPQTVGAHSVASCASVFRLTRSGAAKLPSRQRQEPRRASVWTGDQMRCPRWCLGLEIAPVGAWYRR